MKSSSVTFTSNDVLSDSHNLGRCHPSYALLSCFGLPYIIMADEIMIQTFWLSATHTPKVRSCSAWSSGQQFFGCRGCRLSVAVQLPGPPWPGGPGAHPSLVWPVFFVAVSLARANALFAVSLARANARTDILMPSSLHRVVTEFQ